MSAARPSPGPLRALAAGLAVTALAACTAASDARPVGAACDARHACDAPLLCLDGRCVERESPPDATLDTGLPPVAHVDVPAPSDLAADAPPSDDADATPVEPRLVLGPHEALTAPSDLELGFALEQGPVREVTVPEAARFVAIEVVVGAPVPAACGMYAPAIWLPDATGDFDTAPTWRAPSLPLVAPPTPDDGPAAPVVLAPEGGGPELAPGRVRFGIVYEGPCPSSIFAPWIVLDASGDASDSMAWASTWIPAASLGLPGHWGLSLAVAPTSR